MTLDLSAECARGGHTRERAGTPTSKVFEELLLPSHSTTVTLDWLLQHLGRRSFGMVLLLLGLLALIPGISIVASVLILVPAYQMIFARERPSFSRSVGSRAFAKKPLAAVLRRAVPALRLLERFIRPRWHTPFESTKRVVGIAILLMGCLLFVPVPLSNVPPAIAIVLLAFAYLEEDGVLLSVTLLIILALLLSAAWLCWRAFGANGWF